MVGHQAPLFSLTSVQGDTVDLAPYRGRANVVVWFSRGFTCPFCWVYMVRKAAFRRSAVAPAVPG